MRGVGPVDPERLGEHGVLAGRTEERLDVVRVRGRLAGCGEPRTDPDGVGSRGEGGRHGSPGRDSPRRNDRHVDRAEHVVQEREQCELASHVATRLGALRDDDVAAGLGRRTRLAHRADLPRNQRTGRVHSIHEAGIRIPIKELDQASARRRNVDCVRVEEREQEVDAEGPPCRGGDLVEHRLERRTGVPAREHAEAAGVRDRGGELRRPDPPHRRELDRVRAADERREPGRQHRARMLRRFTIQRRWDRAVHRCRLCMR